MPANKTALVVDNGSDTIKAGFAKEEAPHSVFFTVLGQTKQSKQLEVLDRPDPHIGDEAKAKKDVLDLTYPIKNSIITDFEAMEEVRRIQNMYMCIIFWEEILIVLDFVNKNPLSLDMTKI